MAVLQTRIFALTSEPDSDWAETLIGRVIRPLVSDFGNALRWFWFSRYKTSKDQLDCNFDAIPVDYVDDFHRSVRFRYEIHAEARLEFEEQGRDLIKQYGYWISDFREYDRVGDTGNDAFLGVENRRSGRAEQRSDLVTNVYGAVSRLVLDALVGPDEGERYWLEDNDSPRNPQRSTFQTVLHLFCNITNVPTEVKFRAEGRTISCKTHMGKSSELSDGRFRVQF